MRDEFIDTLLAYANLSLVPGLVAIMTALPLFAVIGMGWAYFSSMEKGRRSWIGAARQVFPLSDYRAISARSDFYNYTLQLLVIGPVLGLLVRLVGTIVSAEIVRSLLGQAFGSPMPIISNHALIVAVQASALILATDFGEFVAHYLSHKVPFLWSLHRAHHSAESLIVFTINRTHPLGSFLSLGVIAQLTSALIVGTVLYLTHRPLDPLALTLFGAFFSVHTLRVMLQHSRIRMSFGWLNHVFVAPVLHHVHHSAELRHRDKNMGASFALWDWMFGTLYLPQKDESWRTGLNEEEIGRTNPHIRVRDFYLEPIRHMLCTLFGRTAPGAQHRGQRME